MGNLKENMENMLITLMIYGRLKKLDFQPFDITTRKRGLLSTPYWYIAIYEYLMITVCCVIVINNLNISYFMLDISRYIWYIKSVKW